MLQNKALCQNKVATILGKCPNVDVALKFFKTGNSKIANCMYQGPVSDICILKKQFVHQQFSQYGMPTFLLCGAKGYFNNVFIYS